MNRARIKQIFIELATKVSTAVDSGASVTPPPGPISDTFLMRNNLVLYGELARLYFESVYEAGSLAIADPSWSRDTIDDLFATHLAAVLERDATDHALEVPIRSAAAAIIEVRGLLLLLRTLILHGLDLRGEYGSNLGWVVREHRGHESS